jgi:hypothetical protein
MQTLVAASILSMYNCSRENVVTNQSEGVELTDLIALTRVWKFHPAFQWYRCDGIRSCIQPLPQGPRPQAITMFRHQSYHVHKMSSTVTIASTA